MAAAVDVIVRSMAGEVLYGPSLLPPTTKLGEVLDGIDAPAGVWTQALLLGSSSHEDRELQIGGLPPPLEFTAVLRAHIDPSNVDLSSDAGRDFKLTARIATLEPSATIAAKAFAEGLWRPGANGPGASCQGKLLFLRNGRVCFDIGWVGVLEGATRVNDGKEHEVGVVWLCASREFSILVDGQHDTVRRNSLRGSVIADDPETRLTLGIPVGHRVEAGVANGDMSARMQGYVRHLRYNGQPVRITEFAEAVGKPWAPPGEWSKAGGSGPLPPHEPAAVDLGSHRDKDFQLTAHIVTLAPSATIVAKAFPGGLWRPGTRNGQGKLLFLRDGRVCFDIGWVGVIEGATRVNDGREHEVGVRWECRSGAFRITVDGQLDLLSQNSLGGTSTADDADTSLAIGIAVGHQVHGGRANGSMSQQMRGAIRRVSYNGRPVNITAVPGAEQWMV